MLSHHVLGMLKQALDRNPRREIDDVTADVDGEIIITTDDGTRKQVWVLTIEETE